MPRQFLLTVLTLLLVPGLAAAQNDGAAELLVEGRSVRVDHCDDFRGPSPKWFSSYRRDLRVQERFLALDGDTLRMRTDSGGEIAIPTPCINHLWVVDGKKTSLWLGARRGLPAGAVIGALIGSKNGILHYFVQSRHRARSHTRRSCRVHNRGRGGLASQI